MVSLKRLGLVKKIRLAAIDRVSERRVNRVNRKIGLYKEDWVSANIELIESL